MSVARSSLVGNTAPKEKALFRPCSHECLRRFTRHEELDLELARLREEKRQHETEIARLVEAIATGRGGSSLADAIAGRKRKFRQITDRLVEPGRGSLKEKLDELRTFTVSRLADLRRSGPNICQSTPSDWLPRS